MSASLLKKVYIWHFFTQIKSAFNMMMMMLIMFIKRMMMMIRIMKTVGDITIEDDDSHG